MGSVAEEIVRLSPVPVLTVRPDAAQTGRHVLRTILYPTDFSADSMRALAYASRSRRNFSRASSLPREFKYRVQTGFSLPSESERHR